MKAETSIKINGINRVLVYDWDAIRLLEEKFGHENVADVLASADMAQLADVMECGFNRHNPELKAGDLFDISPPVVDCKKAIDKALTLAYFGTETPEQSEGSKKKKMGAVKLLLLISLAFISGYLLKHFGL